jgi:hypothetical protein
MPLLKVSIKKVTKLGLDVIHYRNESFIKVLELSAKLCFLFVIMEKIYMGEDCNLTLILETIFKLFDFNSLFNKLNTNTIHNFAKQTNWNIMSIIREKGEMIGKKVTL